MDPLGFTRLDPATMDAETLRDLQKAYQFADQTDYEILQLDRHLRVRQARGHGQAQLQPCELRIYGIGIYTFSVKIFTFSCRKTS